MVSVSQRSLSLVTVRAQRKEFLTYRITLKPVLDCESRSIGDVADLTIKRSELVHRL